ncbi:MAG TPA: DNA translocase FtsK [Aeromonadales bacterium]|nr:DNA translocase FtsK [Aeromonadales bacterium]
MKLSLDEHFIGSRRLREGLWILAIAFAAYVLLALISYNPTDPGWSYAGPEKKIHNLIGFSGAWIADIFLSVFGYLAFLLPLLIAFAGWQLIRKPHPDSSEMSLEKPIPLWLRFTGAVILILSGCGLAWFHFPDPSPASYYSGGWLGVWVIQLLTPLTAQVGTTLLLLAFFLASITWVTGLSWLGLMDRLGAITIHLTQKIVHKLKSFRAKRQQKTVQLKRAETFKQKQLKALKKVPPKIEPKVARVKPSIRVMKEKQASLFTDPVVGELPPLSLLDPADVNSKGISEDSLEAISKLLEMKLADFGIHVEVVAVHPGPVITRFELDLAPGVKASKITNLAKDLARSLSTISVRVVEVIPGKSVIGIEIPNEDREIVRLSEVLSSEIFDQSRSKITMALGKDISGNPVVIDLAKMPHMLVAGTTGSGKSVGINAMLISLLYKSSPEDVRLILIDPKMLELSVYEGIPHLLTPVVTDMKDAANALRWCVAEMERRYQLMSKVGVRNLGGFNKKVEEAIKHGEPLKDPLWDAEQHLDDEEAPDLETLPNIVVVIDELADMMMVVGKKVEELIARIAQKARAAGIHLLLATQRPSVDVLTGLIKANIPSRIAFQVSSRIDSRTILDQMGAEQLLGQGDMLYLPGGTSIPTRVHGAFVADDEVHKVVADWKRRSDPDYLEEITNGISESAMLPGSGGVEDSDAEQDELYDQAVEFVITSRRASISAVQRKLKVGYNRAARMVEAMELAGIVSEMQHNGSREVLVPSPGQ